MRGQHLQRLGHVPAVGVGPLPVDQRDVGVQSQLCFEPRAPHVAVVREPGRPPYLRTHADGVWKDDLLAQEVCSAECVLVA
ncbi:MAG: hypothetical protein ACRYGA_14395 [Janthinobacterium lividum]